MILNWTGNTQLPTVWQHLALYKSKVIRYSLFWPVNSQPTHCSGRAARDVCTQGAVSPTAALLFLPCHSLFLEQSGPG